MKYQRESIQRQGIYVKTGVSKFSGNDFSLIGRKLSDLRTLGLKQDISGIIPNTWSSDCISGWTDQWSASMNKMIISMSSVPSTHAKSLMIFGGSAENHTRCRRHVTNSHLSGLIDTRFAAVYSSSAGKCLQCQPVYSTTRYCLQNIDALPRAAKTRRLSDLPQVSKAFVPL